MRQTVSVKLGISEATEYAPNAVRENIVQSEVLPSKHVWTILLLVQQDLSLKLTAHAILDTMDRMEELARNAEQIPTLLQLAHKLFLCAHAIWDSLNQMAFVLSAQAGNTVLLEAQLNKHALVIH